jgi:hypothetical protein
MALAEAVLERQRASSWRRVEEHGVGPRALSAPAWQARGAVYGSGMLVAVFGDSHAHADALDAVIGAADACGVDGLWSLWHTPDPERSVRRTRECCTVALVGNHEYGATGSVDLVRLGEPRSPGLGSLELARERLHHLEDRTATSRRARPLTPAPPARALTRSASTTPGSSAEASPESGAPGPRSAARARRTAARRRRRRRWPHAYNSAANTTALG